MAETPKVPVKVLVTRAEKRRLKQHALDLDCTVSAVLRAALAAIVPAGTAPQAGGGEIERERQHENAQ